ncbi:MAG: gliding motility lipoprotein GldB [Bacteroidota bacterium]|nr:MAG: gliding motility lipoprotein GldB [Bacteroidota bacterium]
MRKARFLFWIVVFPLAIGILLWSCSGDVEEKCAFVPDTKSITVNLQFESFEDSIPAITSKQQLVDFFSRHTLLRDFVFGRTAYPNDSVFINELYARFSNPHFDTLLQETRKVFGDLSELKAEFNTAFVNLKYYYPDFQPPKIQTVITGLETDLFVTDTLIVVGLDYYLGRGAKFRPNLYEYMLQRYEKNFIVPSIMLLYGIDGRLNETDLNDRTLLADMITYGKAYYFAKRMLPCVPDSVLIGYSAEEIAGARANQDVIWKKLVEDEVFFSTSAQMRQKYIAERPKTFDVADQAPGRIGTWVGWQIVNSYAIRKPELSLPDLMRIKSAKEIFDESRYRPVTP